jgi:hypothetical protein
MPKNRPAYILFSVLLVLAINSVFAQCTPNKTAKELKPKMAPYNYDSYSYNEITFADTAQTLEVGFTAFSDVKYRLIFAASPFDEAVKVSVYDKSLGSGARKKVYSNKTGLNNSSWTLDLSAPGVYYIDYEIPAKGSSKSPDGCVILLIGFQQD